MSFESLNLNNALNNAIEDLGFTKATPIQLQAYPAIRSGRDIIGIAQTGTGKTLSYLLPILRDIKYSAQINPRVLIVVPTRELVIQLVKDVEDLAVYLTLRVGGVYGGTNMNTQKKIVLNGLDILIATPGRLLDLVLHGALNFKSLQTFIIDEVDEMLDLGFRPQLQRVFDLLPKKRQNLMFSATLTGEVESLIIDIFNDPLKIEIVPTGTTLDNISQNFYAVSNFNTKVNLLQMLIQDPEWEKVLVFISTKKLADRLYEKMLENLTGSLGIIHSNKSQNFRINSVNSFADGSCRILIATDIIARGLDITGVTHVINFDVPDYPVNYIHRIGRTGRAEESGHAITFCTDMESQFLEDIQVLIKKEIPKLDQPKDLIISHELIPEERPKTTMGKHNLGFKELKDTGGAFHEKKQKNEKKNFEGMSKRKFRDLKRQKKWRKKHK